MARKRDRSKRKDYRKGGRVKYAHGGRPSRRDYNSGDEYQMALEQWRNDPAHQGKSKAPVKSAVSTPVQQPVQQPAPVQQPPQRQAPFKPFNPADRDMQESASVSPPMYSSFPKVTGTTKGRPSTTTTVTERVKSTGGMEDTYDTYPIRPPTAGTVTEVKRTDTGLNLDAADTALLNLNQTAAQKESITNKVGSLYSKAVTAGKKVTVVDVLTVGVEALVNPLSLIWKGTTKAFDLAADVIGPLFDKAEADGLPVTAADTKALVDIIDTQIKVGNKTFIFEGGKEIPQPTKNDIARSVAATLIKRGEVAVDGIAMEDIVSGKVSAGKSGTVLGTMPLKFSGVGPGTQFDKEGAGDDPPADPDAPVGSLGVEGDKAAAAAAVGYSVGSGMGARGDAWRSEDGGNYEDTTYGTNPDGVPQSPDAARKFENKRRELEGLDTDVDGNPLPLGNKHFQEAQRAMNNLGRQPNAEETQNWLYANYPEAYKATLREQGIDTTNYVHTPFDVNTNPIPTQTQIETETGEDTVADDTTNKDTENTTVPDNKSRQIAQDIVAGTAQGPQIPTPQQVQVGPDATTMQMDAVDTVAAPTITAPTLQASQAQQAAQAQAPDAVTAAQMQAAQVTSQEQIAAATGAIGDDSIAKAAQVDRVAPISGADVTVPEGALAERVIGTLSPNATAIAAQAAGTTLSKVTRAKKQLRNAGMSEEAIAELGNDPENLEDRLMNFTETERGVIGDLPEEALVSNQLDSLLKGMENGDIPTWANPAVSAVEQMLAQRGLSASTVGRDNLFNAIIQSAVPIAQANAQAIQQSVAQSRDIESKIDLFNAQARQQTALQNATSVFQMDMAQFSADQQTTLSNSKFMQTIGLTEATNDQQATIQNATLLAQANLAEADFYQKTQIQNAQAFLQVDLTNLTNTQQSNILTAQMKQQTMLSNQAAQNAASQFNATSENQTQQFMTGLAAQISTTNAQQQNAMRQFNVQQNNANNAIRFQTEADLEKANSALKADIDKTNAQLSFSRDQWNKQNAQAVEQSNVAWRRQVNTANTAADNQVAMQNAMNAFNLNSQSLAFLWQELRDQADQKFKSSENYQNREVQLLATAMANEGDAGKTYDALLTDLIRSLAKTSSI